MEKVSRAGWKKGCTERINKLRDAYFANDPEMDIERADIGRAHV